MSHIPPSSKSWWICVDNRPESNNNSPPLLPPLGSKAPCLILNITTTRSVFLCSPWPSSLCAQHSSQNFHSKTPMRLNFFSVQNPPLASHVTLDKSQSPLHDRHDPTLHCFSDLISLHGSCLPLCQPPEAPCSPQTGQTYAATAGSLYRCFLSLNALPICEHGSRSGLLRVSAHISPSLKRCFWASCIKSYSCRPSHCLIFLPLRFFKAGNTIGLIVSLSPFCLLPGSFAHMSCSLWCPST